MKKILFFLTFLLFFSSLNAQTSFTSLVEKTEKSVVSVKTFSSDGTQLMLGTAFFIDQSGVLISNYHVFKDAFTAKIVTSDEKEFEVDSIISFDKALDLIKFNIKNSSKISFPFLEFSDSSPIKGEDIFVIGTPGGFESSVSKGIVSGIRVVPEKGTLYQITAPISSGSSGSPVINMQGKVIGIATLQYKDAQNLNFAIDINLVNMLSKKNESLNDIPKISVLPDDKDEASKIINSYTFYTDGYLNVVNEYINKFPNDYLGYFRRAVLFNTIIIFPDVSTPHEFFLTTAEYINKSDKDFKKALALSPDKTEIYYYRGISRYNNYYNDSILPTWNLESALSDLNNAIGFDKGIEGCFSRHEYIGDIKSKLKKYNEAIISYKQAIAKYPERPKLFELYGKCADLYYSNIHDLQNSLKYIDLAISNMDMSKLSVTDNFYSWNLFTLAAKIKYELGDLSGALSDLNIIFTLSHYSEKYESYNYDLKAKILEKMNGDANEIVSALNFAIQYSRDQKLKPDYYLRRSKAYVELGYYQMALIDINNYFALTPFSKQKSNEYSMRSDIKNNLNDNIGALKDINKAIELDFKNPENYSKKGNVLYDLKDFIASIKAYDKAIQLNSQKSFYFKMRGFAKFQNDNKSGACADWSKAGEMGDYSSYDIISKYCN